jgi:hypothetical protein
VTKFSNLACGRKQNFFKISLPYSFITNGVAGNQFWRRDSKNLISKGVPCVFGVAAKWRKRLMVSS